VICPHCEEEIEGEALHGLHPDCHESHELFLAEQAFEAERDRKEREEDDTHMSHHYARRASAEAGL
jgi:hypothetical protein